MEMEMEIKFPFIFYLGPKNDSQFHYGDSPVIGNGNWNKIHGFQKGNLAFQLCNSWWPFLDMTVTVVMQTVMQMEMEMEMKLS